MNLIIQPEAGLAPVVKAIKRARKTIDIAIFRIDRDEIERALAAAVQRGVRVRLLVAHTNRGGEARLRKLEQRMLEAGVTVTRTGDEFIRYHGKYMIADDILHLFAFNFTTADTVKSRSFGVSTRDTRAVREALALFDADCTRRAYSPNRRSPLVVSPETARETLTTFITGAKKQLLVYDVNIQDQAFVRLLAPTPRRMLKVAESPGDRFGLGTTSKDWARPAGARSARAARSAAVFMISRGGPAGAGSVRGYRTTVARRVATNVSPVATTR